METESVDDSSRSGQENKSVPSEGSVLWTLPVQHPQVVSGPPLTQSAVSDIENPIFDEDIGDPIPETPRHQWEESHVLVYSSENDNEDLES